LGADFFSEEKFAKVIRLLEDSRRDNPNIDKAETMGRAVETQPVLDAITERPASAPECNISDGTSIKLFSNDCRSNEFRATTLNAPPAPGGTPLRRKQNVEKNFCRGHFDLRACLGADGRMG
jgi:hypothetical protein